MLANHSHTLKQLVLVLALFVTGCASHIKSDQSQSAVLPTPIITKQSMTQEIASTPTLNQPTFKLTATQENVAEPPTDTGWEYLEPGLERRIQWVDHDSDAAPEKMYLLRIDPDFFEFDISYQPDKPQSLTDWMAETGAFIVVNGGYFTEDGKATGLVIIDGKPSGQSFQGFGGMVSITAENIAISWLGEKPYMENQSINAGLQSFPMLVKPGNQLGYPDEDGMRARRTAIAEDHAGNILFILATSGTFTLHEFSRYLVGSDLELDVALNLDGGASSGLLLKEPIDGVPPFTTLPIVITVHPRPVN